MIKLSNSFYTNIDIVFIFALIYLYTKNLLSNENDLNAMYCIKISPSTLKTK